MRRDVEMHGETPTKKASMNLKFIHPVKKPDKVTYNHLAALARQGLGRYHLSPDEVAEVWAAIARSCDRQFARERGPRDPLTDPDRHIWRLYKLLGGENGPIYQILSRNYRIPPYSRETHKSRTHLILRFGTPSAYSSTEVNRVWHDNKWWQPVTLWLFLTLPTSWRVNVYAAGLAEAGGMLTLSAKQVAEDAWEASWLVQERRYDFRVKSGYIVRAVDGTYVHARWLKHARAIAEKRAKAWAEKIQVEERKRAEAEAQARLRELRDQLAGMTRGQILAAFGDVPISIKDSVRAGNCDLGTRQWCNKWADGRTSGTIHDVLNTGAPLDEYLLRALAVAIARQPASA